MRKHLKEIFTVSYDDGNMIGDGIEGLYSREGLSQEALDSIAAAEEKARQEEEAQGEKPAPLPSTMADPPERWSESDINTLSELGLDDAPAALEDATPKMRSLNTAEPDEK